MIELFSKIVDIFSSHDVKIIFRVNLRVFLVFIVFLDFLIFLEIHSILVGFLRLKLVTVQASVILVVFVLVLVIFVVLHRSSGRSLAHPGLWREGPAPSTFYHCTIWSSNIPFLSAPEEKFVRDSGNI